MKLLDFTFPKLYIRGGEKFVISQQTFPETKSLKRT